MILAKQEFEVAYPLASGITNVWAGLEIHFYLLVLKCRLRKFLQICTVYCFIDAPSCHHSAFPSTYLILSLLPSQPPQKHKKPKQTKNHHPKPKNTHIWLRLYINDQMEMNQISLIRGVIIRYIYLEKIKLFALLQEMTFIPLADFPINLRLFLRLGDRSVSFFIKINSIFSILLS